MNKRVRKGLALLVSASLVVTSMTFIGSNNLKAADEEAANQVEQTVEDSKQEAETAKVENPSTNTESLAIENEPQKEKSAPADKPEVKDSETASATDEIKQEANEGEDAEEIRMPAQSFKETAGNGIVVSVSAPEGAFPEGTVMKVAAVSSDRALSLLKKSAPDAVDAQGVDITFFKDGKEIEPEKKISVKLSGAAVDGDDHNIYHVADNGAVNLVTGNATAAGGSFKADDFSIYIVEGEEQEDTDQLTVIFRHMRSTGGRTNIEDIEKNYDLNGEEYNISYNVPEITGMSFSLGDESVVKLENGVITGTVPAAAEDKDLIIDIIYTPEMADYTIRHIYEGAGDAAPEIVEEIQQGEIGEQTTVKDFVKEKDGFTVDTDSLVDETIVPKTETEGTVVEINYKRNTYVITYDTQGGSYIKPVKNVKYGESAEIYKKTPSSETTCNKEEHTHTAAPTLNASAHKNVVDGCYRSTWSLGGYSWKLNCGKTEHKHNDSCYKTEINNAPTRQGYTFEGWYLDPGYTQVAPEETEITSNLTVYAKWKGETVNYTVVYYKEIWDNSTNSSYYAFDSMEVKSAQAGATVSGPNAKKFNYYEYKGTDSKTVKADGSTVVGVYYDLIRYTIVFDLDKTGSKIVTSNGREYTGSSYKLENVVLGMDMNGRWPSRDPERGPEVVGPKGSYYNGWGNNGTLMTLRFKFDAETYDYRSSKDGNTITYKAHWTTRKDTINVEYWLQTAEDPAVYEKSNVYSQTGVPGTSIGQKTLYGFSNGKTPTYKRPNGEPYPSSSGGNYYYYYVRDTETLTFKYKDKVLKEEKVLFEANISGKNYTPDRPADVDEEATFAGWFDNEECQGEVYSFGTMPGNNVVLYAKWAAPTKNVTLVYNNGEKNKTVEVAKNQPCDEINPTKAGYIFDGWFTEDGEEFDISNPITEDITLTAHWTKKEVVNYTVKFETEEGDAVAEAITGSGKAGSEFTAKAASPTVAKYENYSVDKFFKTITLDGDESKNVVTFIYSTFENADYVIQYYCIKDGKEVVVAESEPINSIVRDKTVKVQRSLIPHGYVLSSSEKTEKKVHFEKSGQTEYVKFKVEPVEYSITYVNVSGDYIANHPSSYTVSDKIEIEQPAEDGMVFLGWSYGPSGLVKVSGGNAHDAMNPVIEPTSHADVTFTADWAKLEVSAYEDYYDGAEHAITAKVVDRSGANITDQYRIYYKDSHGDWVIGLPTATNVSDSITNLVVKAERISDGKPVNANPTKLVVKPRPVDVTIVGNHITTKYDGEAHTASGYKVTISDERYTESDFTFSGNAEATRTKVGKTDMKLAETQFVNNNENWAPSFKVTDGYVEITKGDKVVVEIAGNTTTATYDGDEHTASGYTVKSISDSKYTEADFEFAGQAAAAKTTAGTKHMGLTSAMFADKSGDYEEVEFRVTDGYVKINPLDVTVTIAGNTKTETYDGKPHTANGYTTNISSALYTEDDFTFTGEAKASRTDSGKTDMNLSGNQFTNNNNNFNVTFNVTDGWVKIDPVEEEVVVTVEGNKDTKTYDGDEHQVSGYVIKNISNDLYGESNIEFSGAAEAARTDAGTTPMNLTAAQFANTDKNFKNVKFEVTDGSMTIEKAELTVTITGNSETATYDGDEHTASGYVPQWNSELYSASDIVFNGTAEAKRTEAGTTSMGLEAESFGNANNNFEVTFKVTDGYMQINPIADEVVVKIKGHTNTQDYTGSEHQASGYDVEIRSELYAESMIGFSGTAEAKRTDAGKTEMGLTAEQFANLNKNFSNVKFEVTDGWVEVKPLAVTVTVVGNHDVKTYDGEEHQATGYEITSITSNLYDKKDISFSGEAVAKRTNKGTTKMELSNTQFSNSNDNFNVTFEVTDGYIEITAVDEIVVTITGKNATLDYSGSKQTVSGYDVSINSSLYTASDFEFRGDANAERTNVGTSKMGLSEAQFVNKNENFKKVTFEVTDGYITINPIAVNVAVTGNTDTVTYDGQAHSASGYSVSISNKLYTENDFSFSGSAVATGTDAGTTPMGLAENQFTNNNDNFQVTFEVTDGWMKIDPVADEVVVSIKGNKDTETYDGQAHSASGYSVSISNKLYTENDFSFSGSAVATRTDAGTTNMGLAEDMFANISDNFKNVRFAVEDGSMTIEKKAVTVTITGQTDTQTYDGQKHSVNGYEAKISDNLYKETDFAFNGTAAAERTDAGTTFMGLAAESFVNNNDNFEVTFAVTDGWIKIDPFDEEVVVTIIGNKGEQTYDAAAHTASGYEVVIVNSLYTENDFSFTGTATATRTEVGTTQMNLDKNQFANISENFTNVKFKVTDGSMTIDTLAVTVKVTGNFTSAVYDGKEHTAEGYEIDSISSNLYTTGDFSFTGKETAKRTSIGTTNMGMKPENFENQNKNFQVEFQVTDGYVEITPVEEVVVTIVGKKKTATYDGKPHTVTGYEVTINNALYSEEDFEFSGKAEASGTNVGTSYMGLKEDQFVNNNKNFKKVTFKVTDGSMTINQLAVTVTVTGKKDSQEYDGTEHSTSGYEVTSSSKLYTENSISFSGTASAARTEVGTTQMDLSEDQFTNTNENFTVTFKVSDGCMEITPVKSDVIVTITGKNDTKTYDDQEHGVTGYDVEIDNALYAESDFSFNGTASAVRTEYGKTEMGLTAEQFANQNNNFSNVKFEVTDGYMQIEKAPVTVTVTGNTLTKEYDGTEYTASGYTVDINNSLYTENDFAFNGTAEAKRTNAGKTGMNIAKSSFTNENDNFDVTFDVTDGYVEITPVAAEVVVTITGNATEATYDAAEHKATGYEVVEISNSLYSEKDFSFSGKGEAARTNAGKTQMGLTVNQFANLSKNFSNVKFEVTDGYVDIAKLAVNVAITGHNDAKTYDGEVHKATGYDVEISNVLYTENDFTFSGTAEAARTVEGTTEMGLSKEQFANNNENFTVSFTVEDGWMKIDAIDEVTVIITGATDSKTYDGETHEAAGYDVSISNNLYKKSDFEFKGQALVSRTDAGKDYMGLKENQFVNNNKNFKKVVFEVTDGWINIDPLAVKVTVTGNTDSKVYDGKEHTVTGYKAEADSKLYGENDFSFAGEAAAARTGAGTTPMNLREDQFTNTDDNFTVSFDVTDGWMKIDPVADEVVVTIKGNNDTKTYDGQAHSANGYTVSIDNKLYTENDFTFSGSACAEKTDAGKTPMKLAASQFTNQNNNFSNVKFAVTDGYMQIEKAPVEVTVVGNNDTKTYDGKSHQAVGYKVSFNNDLYSESDIKFTGKAEAVRTKVGTTDMKLDKKQFANTNENFEATFKITDGYMTITPVKEVVVTIRENSDKVLYDGKSHTVSGYEVVEISNDLYTVNDFTFKGKAEVTNTAAGTYGMELMPVDFKNASDNFEKVTFVIEDGQLAITPRHVVLKPASAIKKYDGKPLTRDVIEVGGDGFAEGEGFIYKFTGSQTEVGSSRNTFEYTVDTEMTPDDFLNNYVVEVVYGTLRVTANGHPVDPDGPTHGTVNRVIADANGDTTVTTIADAKTPLAKFAEVCCILHLLLLLILAAMLVLFWYTNCIKRRQKAIFEIEEKLNALGIKY